jgi:hypothetical protein
MRIALGGVVVSLLWVAPVHAQPPGSSESVAVVPESPSDGSTARHAGLAIAAGGVIALGIGIGYGFKARDISDRIANVENGAPWPANIHEIEERGQRYESRERQWMIAGGALIAGGAITYVVGHVRGKRAEALMVAASPTSVGVAGRF